MLIVDNRRQQIETNIYMAEPYVYLHNLINKLIIQFL